MSIWISIIATILFGSIAISCFYAAFKTYKDDDEDYLGGFANAFEFIAIFFAFVLWVCKKLFSQTHYILAFRTVAFLMGLIMIGVISLFWYFLDRL